MKMLALFLTIFSSCHSFSDDAGLLSLRQRLNPLIEKFRPQLDLASEMKPILVTLGTLVSKNDCDFLKKKISQSYNVSPFDFVYEGGSSHVSLCGLSTPTYQLDLSGKSSFGVPFSKVLQVAGGPSYGSFRDWVQSYFIDDSFRIVQIQTVSFLPNTNEVFSYGITSVDPSGSVYMAQFDKRFKFEGTDIEGKRTYEVFMPNDGIMSRLSRLRIKNENSAKDFEEVSVHFSDQKDWQAYELPVTHAWANGFYLYDGKYFSENRFYSSLWLKYRGGHQVCAWGTVKKDKTWENYPQDPKALESCANL